MFRLSQPTIQPSIWRKSNFSDSDANMARTFAGFDGRQTEVPYLDLSRKNIRTSLFACFQSLPSFPRYGNPFNRYPNVHQVDQPLRQVNKPHVVVSFVPRPNAAENRIEFPVSRRKLFDLQMISEVDETATDVIDWSRKAMAKRLRKTQQRKNRLLADGRWRRIPTVDSAVPYDPLFQMSYLVSHSAHCCDRPHSSGLTCGYFDSNTYVGRSGNHVERDDF